MDTATLIFFSGKMGAGKSTQAKIVAADKNAVLLSEDEWLESIYPNAITSLEDYIHYSNQLKSPIKQLVQSILTTGTNVVMDFPANTIAQRQWFKEIFTATKSSHQLIYIDVTNQTCLQQIEKRRIEQPHRAATDTPEMFAHVTQYFVEPVAAEGFNISKLTRN